MMMAVDATVIAIRNVIVGMIVVKEQPSLLLLLKLLMRLLLLLLLKASQKKVDVIVGSLVIVGMIANVVLL